MPPVTMHVIGSLDGGGAERLLINLVTQQRAADATALVVCLRPGGVFRPALVAAHVEVIDISMRRGRLLSALVRLARLIRERRPAVIQSWMYHANVFAWLALWLAGRGRTRLLWGIFCSDMDGRRYPWRNVRFVRTLGRLTSRHVDGIVYNADEARHFHRAIGFREPHALVIPNCLDTTTFARDAHLRGPVRRALGIPDDAVVVVTAARVDPMKDWTGLLAAVADIPNVVTVAIGDGTDALPPQPGFIGLGWCDDVARVFSAADVFVLLSAFGEGTSLAVNEAMACSLPCVVTDVGGNGAAVGDSGIVVPRGQIGPVREALLKLTADPTLRESMGRQARARVATAHSADDVAAMISAFLNRISDATRVR